MTGGNSKSIKIEALGSIPCTVMVFDLEGYTALSENISAQTLAKYLEHVFTPVLSVLASTRAYDFHYAGDGIMAAWYNFSGAGEAALRAIRAALKIRSEIRNLSRLPFQNKKIPAPGYGIGICSGMCYLMKVGGKLTIVGDTVNAAHRLQNYTRECDVNILLDDLSRRWAEKTDLTQETVDQIQFYESTALRGRNSPIETHFI